MTQANILIFTILFGLSTVAAANTVELHCEHEMGKGRSPEIFTIHIDLEQGTVSEPVWEDEVQWVLVNDTHVSWLVEFDLSNQKHQFTYHLSRQTGVLYVRIIIGDYDYTTKGSCSKPELKF